MTKRFKNKNMRENIKKRYKAIYEATEYGRHFVSGRFLKLNEVEGQPTVFDKRNSEFIDYVDAIIELKIEGAEA